MRNPARIFILVPLIFAAACAVEKVAIQPISPHRAAAQSAPAAPLSSRESIEESALDCTVIDLRGDPEELALIARALREAAPRLRRWGRFRAPIVVRVLADHAALEEVAQRPGYPWLRAWSLGDELFLQSPQSWSEAAALEEKSPDALEQELAELLAHELTHSLMYQLLSRADGVLAAEPPLWFREGMASFTAGQDAKRLTAEELARWLAAHPGSDLFDPSPELLRDEQPAIYGAAHRAFALFVSACGESSATDLLTAMRDGATFPDAFAARTGSTPEEFRENVVAHGFSGAGLSLCGAPREQPR